MARKGGNRDRGGIKNEDERRRGEEREREESTGEYTGDETRPDEMR